MAWYKVATYQYAWELGGESQDYIPQEPDRCLGYNSDEELASLGVKFVDDVTKTYTASTGQVIREIDLTVAVDVELDFDVYDEDGNLLGTPAFLYFGSRGGLYYLTISGDNISSSDDIIVTIDGEVVTEYWVAEEDGSLLIAFAYSENESDSENRTAKLTITSASSGATFTANITQYNTSVWIFGFNDDDDNYTLDEKTIVLVMSEEDYNFELSSYNVPYSGSSTYSKDRDRHSILIQSKINGTATYFNVQSISDDCGNEYETSDVNITYSSSYNGYYYLTVPVLAFTDDEKSRLLTIVLRQETTNSTVTLYVVMTKVEITFSNATGLYGTLKDGTLDETFVIDADNNVSVGSFFDQNDNTDTYGSIEITAKTFIEDYEDKIGTYYPFIIIVGADNTEITITSTSFDETVLQLDSTDIDRTDSFSYFVKFAASVDTPETVMSTSSPAVWMYIQDTEEESESDYTLSDNLYVYIYYINEQEDKITIESYDSDSNGVGFTLTLTELGQELFDNGYLSCEIGGTDITSTLKSSGSYYVEDGGSVTVTFVSAMDEDVEEILYQDIMTVTQDESGLTSNVTLDYRIGEFDLGDSVSIYDGDNSTLLSSSNTLNNGNGGDYCIHFTMESYIYDGSLSDKEFKSFKASCSSTEVDIDNTTFNSEKDEYEMDLTIEENYSRTVRSFSIVFTQSDTTQETQTLTIYQPVTSWLFGMNSGLYYDSVEIEFEDYGDYSIGPITSKDADNNDVDFSVTQIGDGITYSIEDNYLKMTITESSDLDTLIILTQETSGLTCSFKFT